MHGISDLKVLLKQMRPMLSSDIYVFCSFDKKLDAALLKLNPIGIFQEEEGLTVILEKQTADQEAVTYNGTYNKITLQVHSSLEAVGLTAAFSNALNDENISANVVAGYYHDHIFVPEADGLKAMAALEKLSH